MYNSRALQGIKLRLSQFYPMDPSGKLGIFEQRILPHLPAAYNLARWLLRNQEDAEDAVQESYIKAFRYFDGFEGTDARGCSQSFEILLSAGCGRTAKSRRRPSTNASIAAAGTTRTPSRGCSNK